MARARSLTHYRDWVNSRHCAVLLPFSTSGSRCMLKLYTSYRPTFTKIPRYCFNTSNGTETIAVSTLFRRLKKNCFFDPPWIGNTPTLTSSKRTQNRNTSFTIEARVVRQTHSVFFSGGPRAVVCVCRRKCVVGSCPATRSPSCGRLLRQTIEPLPPPTCVVSSSTYLLGWTDHGAVTASNGANTTKMRWQQGQKDQTNDRSGLRHLGRYDSHFFCAQSCQKGRQKNRKTQWAEKSYRADPVPGSFWRVRTHAMM